MKTLGLVFFIIGFILCIISTILFYRIHKIKIIKQKQQEQYELNLSQKVVCASSNLNLLNKEIQATKLAYERLSNKLIEEKNRQNEKLEQYRQQIKNRKIQCDKELEEYNQRKIKEMNDMYIQATEQARQEYKKYTNQIEQKKDNLIRQLKYYQNSVSATIEDQARERQKREKLNFYKLSLTNEELSDVEMLQKLKSSFHQPVILSKLIWTQFFQKQMTDLCNRVLNGRKSVCGIYKITDLITKQYYIGQSKTINDRWKTHCKYGLGIDTPATNALYKAMQKDGVWNFTFQLLEECKPKELNEKEAFWIETYKSNTYGLNTQAGNKKKG